MWVQRIDPQRLLQAAPHISRVIHHTCKPDPRLIVVLIRLDDANEELPCQGALSGARCRNTLLEQIVGRCHEWHAPFPENQEPRTENRELRTRNQEPRTENQELRTEN
jgi:hypothetical protein